MMKKVIFAAILICGISLMLGCSQPSPVEVTATTGLERNPETNGHMLLGYYEIYLDPSGPSIEVVPSRQMAKHYNVKSFVLPPACMDCVQTQPMGPYKNKILPMLITLKNPQPVAGYDVRGIIISNDPGLTLNNPDNYTSLFDDGGAVTINPFKAFAADVTKRKFGAGESHSVQFNLYLEKFGKVTKINYAVDASWPGRAKEPYLIGTPWVNGQLDSYGVNDVKVKLEVYAAGDNVDEVTVDLTSLGFDEPFVCSFESGDIWTTDIFKNTPLAPEGVYKGLAMASTASSNEFLYQYFDVIVVLGEPLVLFSEDVQPVFDNMCTSCHQSVSPPEDLDLTEGNAYSHLVNVDSQQSPLKLVLPESAFESYLIGKIWGIHDLPPFEGSGERMPKNGPPWVSDEDTQKITTWIMQGALDN